MSTPEVARIAKQTEVQDVPLFDTGPSWVDHWWGMPSYVMEDCTPYVTISVHFSSWDDVEKFAATIGQRITRQTKYLWFPEESPAKAGEWSYV